MNIISTIEVLSQLSSITRYSQSILAKPENVLEHTGFVACICLAIAKELEAYGADIDKGKLLEKALVHDLDEIITGDIARPTKYSSDKMLELMDELSKEAIKEISELCGVDFEEHWSESKKGKEGLIVDLADILSVVYKAFDEVVVRGNKSINFGSVRGLKRLVRKRINNLFDEFKVDSLFKIEKDLLQMLDKIEKRGEF